MLNLQRVSKIMFLDNNMELSNYPLPQARNQGGGRRVRRPPENFSPILPLVHPEKPAYI